MEVQLIYQPKLTLLARPQFMEPAHLPVKWLEPGTDGERLSEFAGRLCYMSQNNPADRTTVEYLLNILKQGHGSVLEHANYSVLIEGISRSCSHEFVRHRAGWAYSQVSQRYVALDETAFVVPPAIIGDEGSIATMANSCKQALLAYKELVERIGTDTELKRKAVREASRSVLPNATEVKIVATANVRAWRTMLELRCGEGADKEIRRMALMALQLLRDDAPAFFQDFHVFPTENDGPVAVPDYHKV